MDYTIENFDWEFYINEYKDLRDAGILTKEKAWQHWCKYGCNENRINRKIINEKERIEKELERIKNGKEEKKQKIINNTDIKISIVMAYHNRKKQTLKTLKGFEKMYAGKYDFEVIIVDDNSKLEEKLDDEISALTFSIKLIKNYI